MVRVDAGVSDKVNYHADSPFIAGRISDSNCGMQVYNITDPSTGEAFPGVRFFQGFTYTEGSTFDSRGQMIFYLHTLTIIIIITAIMKLSFPKNSILQL